MFSNSSKQIYIDLIKQDFKPFKLNIEDNLTDDTLQISLIKNIDNTIYVVNLLNTFEYDPSYCIKISNYNNNSFVRFQDNVNVIYINVFLCKNHLQNKNFIDSLDKNKIHDFSNIYWSLSFENDTPNMYFNKEQPNKIIGIEKILTSTNKNRSITKDNSLKNITKKAFQDSPLIEKNSVFNFYNLIIIINTIIFFYIFLNSGINTETLLKNGAFYHHNIIQQKEYYRIFTCMFLHANFTHLFSNMATLYIFGRGLERTTSHSFFLLVYFISGIVANIIMLFIPSNSIMVGASGCIFGVLGATMILSYIFKKSICNISFHSILTIVLINLFFSVSDPQISFSVHFIGFIVGIILGFIYTKIFKSNF